MAAMMMAGLDGVRNPVDLDAHGFGPFAENVEQMDDETPSEDHSASHVPGRRARRVGGGSRVLT